VVVVLAPLLDQHARFLLPRGHLGRGQLVAAAAAEGLHGGVLPRRPRAAVGAAGADELVDHVRQLEVVAVGGLIPFEVDRPHVIGRSARGA
jgi:hypothetical protein